MRQQICPEEFALEVKARESEVGAAHCVVAGAGSGPGH